MKRSCGKLIGALVILSSLFACFPAFAAKKKNAAAGTESSQEQVQEQTQNQAVSKKKNDKGSGKKDPKKDDNVFQSRTVENSVGLVKFLLKGTVGSNQIYAVGDNDSQIPLLAGYDEFTSSFLSILVGKKEYKLTNNIGIVIGARKVERGVQMVYVVPDVARILLTYEKVDVGSLVPAKKNMDPEDAIASEIIKVSMTVSNKGKRAERIALKSVFDTVLGEQFGPHFVSSDEIAINSERQYRRFDKVKWLTSANSRAGIQFLFSGADVTPPEVVSISNKDLLALQKWIPTVISSRTFDSVLSYNNSAVCFNWEPVDLAPEAESTVVYYLAVASDGVKCDGQKFISQYEKVLKKSEVKEEEKGIDSYLKASDLYAAGRYSEAYQVVEDAWKKSENRTDRMASLKKMLDDKLGFDDEYSENRQENRSQSSAKVEPAVVSDGVKTFETVGSEAVSVPAVSYDESYINELIQKIESLESSGDDVDRTELLRLNAELDSVIKQLEKN